LHHIGCVPPADHSSERKSQHLLVIELVIVLSGFHWNARKRAMAKARIARYFAAGRWLLAVGGVERTAPQGSFFAF
jgi:hypothetical protein